MIAVSVKNIVCPRLSVSPSVAEHLQEDVHDLRVRLLDFVEEDDGERLLTHAIGQHPALLEPDVAGRRADQFRDRVLLLELAHVEAQKGFFGVEQELGEFLGQERLAHAGGASEKEHAFGFRDRATGNPRKPGARKSQHIDNFLDGLFLSFDSFFLLEPRQRIIELLDVQGAPTILLLADAIFIDQLAHVAGAEVRPTGDLPRKIVQVAQKQTVAEVGN